MVIQACPKRLNLIYTNEDTDTTFAQTVLAIWHTSFAHDQLYDQFYQKFGIVQFEKYIFQGSEEDLPDSLITKPTISGMCLGSNSDKRARTYPIDSGDVKLH